MKKSQSYKYMSSTNFENQKNHSTLHIKNIEREDAEERDKTRKDKTRQDTLSHSLPNLFCVSLMSSFSTKGLHSGLKLRGKSSLPPTIFLHITA